MGFKVHLSDNLQRRGFVQFRSLLVMSPEDFQCEPDGILTFEEVQQVARSVRRLPAAGHGVIGKYRWVEEYIDDKQMVGAGKGA